MNISKALLVGAATLAFSHLSAAEIYESKDAQGNPVFTDTPTNVSDKTVDLHNTNIADPVPDIPEREPQATPNAAKPAAAQRTEGDIVIIGDAHNERLEREIVEHRRNEVGDAARRHEEGDAAATTEENLSATHREFPDHPKTAHPVAHPHPGGRR